MAHVDLGGHYKRFVQFFWDPEPKNDDPMMAPIWCLGRQYTTDEDSADYHSLDRRRSSSNIQGLEVDRETVMISSESSRDEVLQSCDADGGVMVDASVPEQERGWPAEFLDDFEARFWFTYRSHFPPIPKSSDPRAQSSLTLAVRLRSQLVDQGGFTSDTGWGCMIRSGQSLLANAMAILKFGRSWRRGQRRKEEAQLLGLFADDPRAPFSLHRFVQHGASACGKHPGEWFGPSATARCIQALSERYPACGLRIYVTGDGADVYQDTLFRLAKSQGTFQPVLILVGIRLGIDRVTPAYWSGLQMALQLPQSMGIAGGRPSASHYFVGVQGNSFFYLDPHQTRPMLPYHENTEGYAQEDLNSCHTRRLRRLHVDTMDPSMLIAFLIQDEDDWRSWRKSMDEIKEKPLLHIADNEPSFHGHGIEREGALDEVETLDEEDELGEVISIPPIE